MRRYILAALLMSIAVSVGDVSAQSLLKSIGRSLEQAVKKEVNSAVNKGIDKGIDRLKEGIKKEREQQQQEQQQQEQLQQEPNVAKSQKQAVVKPVVDPTDVLIAKMQTWKLVVKDGKPHYMYIDDALASREDYFLYGWREAFYVHNGCCDI